MQQKSCYEKLVFYRWSPTLGVETLILLASLLFAVGYNHALWQLLFGKENLSNPEQLFLLGGLFFGGGLRAIRRVGLVAHPTHRQASTGSAVSVYRSGQLLHGSIHGVSQQRNATQHPEHKSPRSLRTAYRVSYFPPSAVCSLTHWPAVRNQGLGSTAISVDPDPDTDCGWGATNGNRGVFFPVPKCSFPAAQPSGSPAPGNAH